MHLRDLVRTPSPLRPASLPFALQLHLTALSQCPLPRSSAFTEEPTESSQDGEEEEQTEAPGSSLIYFDNCNAILIIYARASEFIGT